MKDGPLGLNLRSDNQTKQTRLDWTGLDQEWTKRITVALGSSGAGLKCIFLAILAEEGKENFVTRFLNSKTFEF